jgi:hypothetical protein
MKRLPSDRLANMEAESNKTAVWRFCRHVLRVAAVARIAIASAAFAGVAIESFFFVVPRGNFNFLFYYTIQSNLILAVVFTLTAVRILNGETPGPRLAIFERSARVWICMTGLGFHFLLSALWHPPGIRGVANMLLHYVVPIGSFGSWLLFEPKGRYRVREIVVWLSYPLLYAGACLVRGHFDGFYPYWFLNPTKPVPTGAGSMAGALLWIGILAGAFAIIGLVIKGLDFLLAKHTHDAGNNLPPAVG